MSRSDIFVRSPSRLLASLSLACAGSVALLALGVALEGCGSGDGDATTGKRVTLSTRVELEPTAVASFTTAVGWSVSLREAYVATGAFYYYDGTPPLARREPSRGSELALRVLGIGTAHAHPGHYTAGKALGQMLEASSVNLLAGPAELPTGDGITGVYRSGTFSFSAPPVGPAADELDGHAAVAVGRADKDGEEPRFFRAVADLADLEKNVTGGRVDGCELTETNIQADGTVTVVVQPAVWFNLVDFSELEPGADGAPLDFPADSQPAIAFSQGLTELSAYHFSYSNP